MNHSTIASPNRAKYNNARINLLLVVIFSVFNLVLLLAAGRYFLFSSYFPQIMISIGNVLYEETSEFLFIILFGVIGLASIVPYLLCWIFSKKHVGCMIGALVLFSLDTLLLLIDFVSLLVEGEVLGIFDVVFHAAIIVYLVFGVKYGIQMNKEAKETVPANDTPVSTSESLFETGDAPASGIQRELTVTRSKAFTGCAIPVVCYVNGKEVCRLKNGETQTFPVPSETFELGATLSSGLGAGTVTVQPGTSALTFSARVKTGFAMSKVELTQIQSPISESQNQL